MKKERKKERKVEETKTVVAMLFISHVIAKLV